MQNDRFVLSLFLNVIWCFLYCFAWAAHLTENILLRGKFGADIETTAPQLTISILPKPSYVQSVTSINKPIMQVWG